MRCHMHNKNGSNCPFRINIQEYNIGKPDHCYKVIDSSILEHNHESNPLIFAHKNLDSKTRQTMQLMDKCNISSTKISDYLLEEKKYV